MIYGIIFYNFFLIGLLSVGGGAATIPFLFDLSEKYNWFTVSDLSNMVAVAESLPGALGINIAVFAGYKVAGIGGGFLAMAGLVLPSLAIITTLVKLIDKFACKQILQTLLIPVQPAVLALIADAAFQIGLVGINSLLPLSIFLGILSMMFCYRTSPVFYIVLSGFLGIIFGL